VSGGVPFFSAWLVVGLLVASVAMFIALIDKLTLLQVHRMLSFTSKQGRRVIADTYPAAETAATVADPALLQRLTLNQTLLHHGPPLCLQALDSAALIKLALKSGGILEVRASVGDTLVVGTEMLRVYGGAPLDEREARAAFALGSERTFEQDPKYAIRLIVDIAIRALSPAVNDPTTAVQALDHLEDLLRRLGERRLEIGTVRDRAGELRLVVPYPAWEDFVTLAFDEIRYYGATSVQVMRRMKALVADLVTALPAERHATLRRHQARIDAAIAKAFDDAQDQADASVEDRQGLGVPRRAMGPKSNC
jgi:uncharacterized membrane protein